MTSSWRSLGGAPLDGVNVTRFVYLDEAGTDRKEPFLVVAGVIVHADRQLNELVRRIDQLRDKYVPAHLRDGFVFHATELFNGGGTVFRRGVEWPWERREEVGFKLADIIKQMDLPIPAGFVQKAHWPMSLDVSGKSEKQKDIDRHVTAYMSCAMQIDLWMRTNTSNEVTMLIAEDHKDSREKIKQLQNAYRRPEIVADLHASDEARRHFPFRKIKSGPLFEAPEDSPALQLADFCAYVMKKRLMNDQRFSGLVSALQPHYAIHGLPSANQPTGLKRRR